MKQLELIQSMIRTVPDFPQKGILFRDTTTLIKDANGLSTTIDCLEEQWQDVSYDDIVAIDARGFVFGSAMAYKLNKGLILARKVGKLPAETCRYSYDLEYGSGELEIHRDGIVAGKKYLVLDDLIATGGTAEATCKIVEELGGVVAGCGFVIELRGLDGRKLLAGHEVRSLIEY